MTAREAIAQALYFANDHPLHTDRLLDEYRAEVLAEAAAIAGTVIGPLWHTDTIAEVQARLNAAGEGR